MSWKGFLHRELDGRLHMTKPQLHAVRRAVEQVLHEAQLEAFDREDVLTLARRVVGEALESFTPTRSCASCDFERSGFCLQWSDDVPPETLVRGCDRYQCDGAPF